MINSFHASKFVKTELELNEISISNHPIGKLLSKFHENSLKGNSKKLNLFGFLFLITKQIFFGMLVQKPFIKQRKTNSVFLFSKIANKPQFNGLIDPLYQHFKESSIISSPGKENQIIPYNAVRNGNVLLQVKTIISILINWKKITMVYKLNDLKIDRFLLFHSLFIQLIATVNWVEILKIIQPKIIVVDFDRDSRNNALITASFLLHIKSVTLVHGVINPPYGYWPVIANEIWCWSRFQQNQLIENGVEDYKIKVVGNPIAKPLNIIKSNNYKNTIGVGLNPMGDLFNKNLLDNLINSVHSTKFKWLIKLHPSMHLSEWLKAYETDSISFHENGTGSSKEFFEGIEVLIVSNSGLGYEALINNVPIWVFRADKNSTGHDQVMINYGLCPDISISETLEKEMKNLLSDSDYIKKLLATEQKFVFEDYYFKIGDEAISFIISILEKYNINDL